MHGRIFAAPLTTWYSGAQMQEIADSFCERCGTRYSFRSPPAKASTLASARLLAKGLKNYVMTDGTSMNDAMESARLDSGHDESVRVAEEFHKTFNFCMSCRQYACDKCWNENQGACLTCAPLWDTPAVAPQDHLIMRMPVSRLHQEAGPGGARSETLSGGSIDRTAIEWPVADLQPADPLGARATLPGLPDQPPFPPQGPVPATPNLFGDRAGMDSAPGQPWSESESRPAPDLQRGAAAPDRRPAERPGTPNVPAEASGSPTEFRTPSWVSRKEEDASDELQARSQSWKSNDDGWSLWPAREAADAGPTARNAPSDHDRFVDEWLGRPGRGDRESQEGWLGAEPSMPPAGPVPPAGIGRDAAAGETSARADAIAPRAEPGSELSLTAEELTLIQSGLSVREGPESGSPDAGPAVEPAAVADSDEQPAQANTDYAAAGEPQTPQEPDIRLQFLASYEAGDRFEEAARPDIAPPISGPPESEPVPPEDARRQPFMARLLGRRERPETEQTPSTPPTYGASGALGTLPDVPTSELPGGEWPRPTRWLDRTIVHHDWWAEEDQVASRPPQEGGTELAPSAEAATVEPALDAGLSQVEPAASAAFSSVAPEPVAPFAPEPAPEPAAPAGPTPEPSSAAPAGPEPTEPALPAPEQGHLFAMPEATTDPWSMSQPNVPARAPEQWPSTDLPDWAVAARLAAGSLEPASSPEPARPQRPPSPSGPGQQPDQSEVAGWPPLGATWPARDGRSSPWQMPPESAPPARALAAHRADAAEIAESPLVAALWEESSQQVIDQGNVRVCRNCALPVSTHARFCRRCGTKQD
jgi:hypothetical protein